MNFQRQSQSLSHSKEHTLSVEQKPARQTHLIILIPQIQCKNVPSQDEVLYYKVIDEDWLAPYDTVFYTRLQRAVGGNAAPGSHMSYYMGHNTQTQVIK